MMYISTRAEKSSVLQGPISKETSDLSVLMMRLSGLRIMIAVPSFFIRIYIHHFAYNANRRLQEEHFIVDILSSSGNHCEPIIAEGTSHSTPVRVATFHTCSVCPRNFANLTYPERLSYVG